MFTTVVFLIAVVDIYEVSRAKLQVQNLADAAALNIATQMVGSINKVADLNEWMNHMVDLGPNARQSLPGQAPDCSHLNPKLLPPISCAENANKSSSLFMFQTKGDAAAYAALVQKVNQSQQLFIDTYNNFIGAGTGSNSSIGTKSSLNSILIADIPELGNPGTTVIVSNYEGGMPATQSAGSTAAQMTSTTPGSLDTSGMQPLKFKVNHDIVVTYKDPVTLPYLGTKMFPPEAKSLGNLLASSNKNIPPVGWMEPDMAGTPQIQVGSGKSRIGARAKVLRAVQVPVLGSITVSAQAEAYVVQDSGIMGIDNTIDPLHPVFKPTYWVKLVGAK